MDQDIDFEFLIKMDVANEVPYNKFEKEEIRKRLKTQIEEYLANGGQITVIHPEPFIPHYKLVGNFRSGVVGSPNRSLNSDSL